jgi:hypothetical protein
MEMHSYLKSATLGILTASILGVGGVANAATFVTGVTSIDISSANVSVSGTSFTGGWLQIAEAQAFDASGMNVALSASTSANFTGPGPDGYGTPVSRINDGDLNSNYYSAPGIYHAPIVGGGVIATLMFTSAVNLSSFMIFGRDPSEGGACCGDRNQFNVTFNRVGAPSQTFYLDARNPAAVAAIPEPGEWAMMLAGLAVVGAIVRRRKS